MAYFGGNAWYAGTHLVIVVSVGIADTLVIFGTLGRHCALGTLGSVPMFAQRDSSCLPVSSYSHGISNILYFFFHKCSLLHQW